MAKMEVDPSPLSGSQPDIASSALPPLNPLKRSNSAPMINVLPADTPVVSSSPPPIISSGSVVSTGQMPLPMSTASSSYPNHPSPTVCHTFQRQCERVRRYSMSSTTLYSSTTPVKVPPQLDRIKREESSNPKEREAAHEHKIQSQAQLSLSWESLHLTDDNSPAGEPRRPKSFQEPLHIFTSPYPAYAASSPSPTRITGKQCFSPSLQQPVRTLAGSLTPSPSPSPTRKSFHRRSMSPIALRPSPLGASLKRKMDSDGDHRMDCYSSPKRHQMTYSPITATSSFSHPLMQSSSSSGEECPQQNGMMPPSHLHPESTPTTFVTSTTTTSSSSSSSTRSFTCRSPLVFAATVSSSSPGLVNNRPFSPQPMDQQPQTPDPSQPQHNAAFRAACHRALANSAASRSTSTPHHHTSFHQHQQQHQQHQMSNNCTRSSSSSNHLNHGLYTSPSSISSPSSSQQQNSRGIAPVPGSVSVSESRPREIIMAPRVVQLSSNGTPPPPGPASLYAQFRPVRDSLDSAMSTGGTDSETSDMAETTDLSETSDVNNSL